MPMKNWVKSTGKSVVYSSMGRALARRLAESTGRKGLSGKAADKIGRSRLRRIASPAPPKGYLYGKLTIRQWQSHLGEDFRLMDGDTVLYGNRIERPQKGFPLEYRNILVSQEQVSRLTLSIDAPWVLQTSPGRFSTPQQDDYDKKYKVETHGDFKYSLRGNTAKPSKLVVTFPGFGPSTTRISYAVSYLQFLPDAVLKESALLAFQDCYGVAGTYMAEDNAGRPLMTSVAEEIRTVAALMGLNESDIIFFGASKGGTVALLAAESFPKAQLLVCVPQLDMPYYLNKPFFENNIGLRPVYREMTQPGELLRRYIREGRRIDHLMSYDDELSNHSEIEFFQSGDNYSRYRFAAAHGAVAKKGVPLILSIIEQFVRGGEPETGELLSLKLFPLEGGEGQYRLQMRSSVPRTFDKKACALAFAVLRDEVGTLFQELSPHKTLPNVFYSNTAQIIDRRTDPMGQASLLLVRTNGRLWETSAIGLTAAEQRPDRTDEVRRFDALDECIAYPVMDKKDFAEFSVAYLTRAENVCERLVVLYGGAAEPAQISPQTTVVRAMSELPSHLAGVVSRRLAVKWGTNSVELHFAAGYLSEEQVLALDDNDWPGFSAVADEVS